MLTNPLSTNEKRTFGAKRKTVDFEQCLLLQLAKRMVLEKAMVQKFLNLFYVLSFKCSAERIFAESMKTPRIVK